MSLDTSQILFPSSHKMPNVNLATLQPKYSPTVIFFNITTYLDPERRRLNSSGILLVEVSTPNVSSELLGAVLLSLRPGCTYHTKGNCMYPNTIGVMECIPSLVLGYARLFFFFRWYLAFDSLCVCIWIIGGVLTWANIMYLVRLGKKGSPWMFQTGGINLEKL